MARVYGFQVVAAIGLGSSMQQNMLVPQGMALTFLVRLHD
jgi:hypothetical protein